MDAFETMRLQLRPLGEDDEALYCRLYTDPELMRHIAAPMSVEAARRNYRAACLVQSPQKQRWIITERSTGEGIGLLGLFAEGAAAEVGVMLLFGSQGRGYAAEAIAAIADRVFAADGMDRLWTRHAPGNGLATGLMRKLGFLCEGMHGTEQLRWEMQRERWLLRSGEHGCMALPGMER